MASYDAEIRVKTKVDNSEVIKLEADLDSAEKKAEKLRDALEQIALNKDVAESAQQASEGMDALARKTRKASEEAEKLDALFKNTKIHLAGGTTLDWNGNVIQEAVRDTTELEQKQESLANTCQKSEEAMRQVAEETRRANEAVRGMDSAAESGVAMELTPMQNMLAFIKKSFQDIPLMFGGVADSTTEKTRQMEYEWDNLSNKADAYKRILKELESEDKGFGNHEYDEAFIQWQQAEQAVRDYKAQLIGAKQKQVDLSTGMRNVGNEGKKAFKKIAKGVKNTGGILGTMATRMKGLLLSLLIFNWISKGFNAMIDGMKKGFDSLMKYSDSYANSVMSLRNAMSTLGNSFAAAFAPIVQMVIPWLNSLIGTLTTAMTYVAQFVAILGGKSTFTRAKKVQDGYNRSLDGTAGAAKKAAGALAKFDDLDVLQKQEEPSGGGAGGAGDMFEEVPVDPEMKSWLDGLLDRLKPILDYVKQLKDAFMNGFWDGLGDYGYRFDIIKEGLQQIKDALVDIWTDPAVLAAADAWLKSLMYMLGSLVGSVASIALTIAAAFIGGLGRYMENNVDRIKKFLISVFNIGTEINLLLADLFQSIAYIFEAFASESGIRFMTALIGSIADGAMGIIEFALKLGRDFLELLILPITENRDAIKTALEGMLSSAATVLEGVKEKIDSVFDNLNAVYDEHFKPFFDSIAKGVSEIVGVALEVWNGKIQPIIDQVAKRLSELGTEYIAPLVNKIVEFAGVIADLLKVLWETILKPLIEWIVVNVFPIIAEGIAGMINGIILVVEVITSTATVILDFLISIVEAVIYFFENWSEIWENVKNNIVECWESILNFLSNTWNAIQVLAANIFTAIKTFLQTTWENIKVTATNVWNAIKLFFTITWSAIRAFAITIWSAIKEFIVDTWSAIKESALKIWEFVREMFEKKFRDIKEITENLIDKFLDFKENVKTVFESVQQKIDDTISPVIDKINSFIDAIRNAIEAVKDFLASGWEKISGIGSGIGSAIGGFFGGGARMAAAPAAASMSYALDSVPHLASGAVIRGGNPFVALLGDQRAGQTNVEAPLSTIETAVENAMSRRGYDGGSLTINLNWDGETFARVSLQDFLSEMKRQGLAVDVLGVT